ncbi:hypothetical protein A3D88_01060 [Candidatus Peribacteria bacterium RIFCSPHIGHO2_02_FULL_52_16]|nr:MAG: hypothetical protein A2706_05705 [Candidatus Peribacteria bacterium RIFCSPHIGHO2_01_FULL_51_35]OGJ61256.1 MAG: hypothetical protein A3D88_01060 [Candidatus Peribacteria bacterium RIFCSPHIGHO2_02_FULL_52_16]
MRNSRLALALAALLILVLGWSLHSSLAQEFLVQNEQAFNIEAGTVFEILAVTDETDAQVSWVLTEERQFVEAGRDRIFRTRFAKTGNYILDGGVYSPTNKTGIRKTLKIAVTAPTPLPTGTGATEIPEPLFVETEPALQGNGLVLQEEGFVFAIKGNRAAAPFTLDLNAESDTNGDGNPENDNDAEKTFFITDATPLHVWIVAPVTKRTIHIGAGAQEKTITLYGNGESIAAPEIESEVGENGAVLFSVRFVDDEKPDTPLHYEWDFGDGTQSLLTSPEHVYAVNDTYTVRVNVINLDSALSLATAETTANVTNAGAVPPPETPGEEPQGNGSGVGSFLWTILKGLLLLLVAVGIGLGAMFLLARFRKSGGLQKKLDQIESTLVPKKEGKKGETSPKSVIDVAPPMELKRTQEKESVVQDKKETPKPAAPATPVKPEEAPTPSWLKKGLDASATTKPAAATPAPKAPTSPVAQPPTPKPVATPPAPKPEAPKAPPAPTPTPPPAPKAPVAPPPELPKSAPVEQSKQETVTPPWLNGMGEETKPAPIVPKKEPTPTPAPKPVPTPAPVAPPAPEKKEMTPVQAPTPPAPSKPVEVKKEPTSMPIPEAKKESTDDEEPIAFIRADSIEEQNGKKEDQTNI